MDSLSYQHNMLERKLQSRLARTISQAKLNRFG